MEEFIKTLTEQMRCVKARNGVAREITDHIADQAEAYERAGMKHDDAVEKAVHEMGDPVEIGVSMDKIHRPQVDWKMMLIILVLSIAGILCMIPIYGPGIIVTQGMIMLASFAAIIVVYFVDYSILGHAGVSAYIVLTVLLWLSKTFYFHTVHGRIPAMAVLVYLYVPIFAGILYRLRMKGYRAVLMAIAVIVMTVYFALSFSSTGGTVLNIFLIMTAVTITAYAKGMFGAKKKGMTALLTAFTLLPFVYTLAAACMNKESFRVQRVMAYFKWSEYQNAEGYLYKVIHDMLNHTKFMGGGDSGIIEKYAIDATLASDIMPLMIVHLYGFFAGIVLLAVFALFIQRAFKIVHTQRNQLGFLVSISCLLVIFVNCAEGILSSFGMIPSTTTVIPFLTRGGSAALVYAVLIGLILSVHRYEKVLTTERYVSSYESKWRLCVKIERR